MKPGYLKYQRMEAEGALSDAFDGSYAETFGDFINVNSQIHDLAGPQAGALVENLPHAEDRHCEAFIGLFILQETHRMLGEILENDRELRESVIGPLRSDDATDRGIRFDSYEFDKRYNLHREQEYLASAREGMLSEKDYADIAAGGDSEQIESDVARSKRNEMEGVGEARIMLHVDNRKKPLDEGKPLTTWAIKIPDLAGQPPVAAFQEATQWAAQGVITVATGTMQDRAHPRIRPLMVVDEPEFLVTDEYILRVAHEIYERVTQLQPPLPDHPDEFEHTLVQLAGCDMRVALHSVEYMLYKFFPEDAKELMKIFARVRPDDRKGFGDALLKLLDAVRKL